MYSQNLTQVYGQVIKIDMSLVIMLIHRSIKICTFINHVFVANPTLNLIKKYRLLHKTLSYHSQQISLK